MLKGRRRTRMGGSVGDMTPRTQEAYIRGPAEERETVIDITRASRYSLADLDYRHSGLDDLAIRAVDRQSDLNRGARGAHLADALDRMGLTEAAAVQALLRDALAQAAQLRHAQVVRGGDAASWIAGVFQREPERLLWHIRRLDGVSPSSAWTYVAESLGQRNWWNTARDLDRTRLMTLLPEPPDWHRTRGTHLEPLARALLYSRHGDRITSDTATIRRAATLRGAPGMPWLIGNPDDVVLLKMGRVQGQRRPNDFKCPAELPDPDDDPSPEYRTQLHLYRLLIASAGVQTNTGMLTHLCVKEELARMWVYQLARNPARLSRIVEDAGELMDAGHDLVQMCFQRVPFEPEFERTVIEACHAADHRILQGKVAPYPTKPRVELSEQDLYHARNLAARLAEVICSREAVESVESVLRQQIAQIYAQTETTGKDAGLGLIALKTPVYLDKERAIEALTRCQVPLADLGVKNETVTYDSKKLRKALIKAGLDPAEYESRQVRLGLPSSPKGAAARRIDQIRAEAMDRLAPLVAAVQNAMERHPAPANPDPDLEARADDMEMEMNR